MTTTKHTHHAEIQRPDPAHEIERVMRWLDAYRLETWYCLDERMDNAAEAAVQCLRFAVGLLERNLPDMAANSVADAHGIYMDVPYLYDRSLAERDMLYTLMCLVAGYPLECACYTDRMSCPACRSAGVLERWERSQGIPVAVVELPVDHQDF